MSPKKPLDSTIDSVGIALSYLFDWLGQEREDDATPDVIGLFADANDDADLDDDDDDEEPDSDVIDTDGESL